VKVSVLVITYNQRATFAECLDSILKQRTSVDFEVVVADDASTDETPAIIAEFAAAHPNRLRFIRREENLGPSANLAAGYRDCQGEYVALCEGDDYWISPNKLDAQVLFMDRHPDCTLCFHPVIQVSDCPDHWPQVFPADSPDRAALSDLLDVNFIPTCSVVYRRIAELVFPDWYARSPLGDWPLHILHAQRGWIAKLDQVMAAYRSFGGVWSGRTRRGQIEDTLALLDHFCAFLGPEHVERLHRTQARLRAELSSLAA
jgi:glycosyltransferase involved in cell wall biosynthesis